MIYFFKKNLLIYYILLLNLFLLLTTKHYDYSSTLIYGGADGAYYIEIAKSFPYFAENKMATHYTQRFIIPYIIGFFSKLFNINIFFTFKLISISLIVILSFIILKIIKIFTKDKFYQIILINLVLLNSYISRFYISIPTIVGDLFFLITTSLISLSIIKNKNFTYIFYSCISVMFRQTGIAFLLSAVINFFIYNKKSFINIKLLTTLVISYGAIFFLINFYSEYSSKENFNYAHVYGIFIDLKNNRNLLDLLGFIILPLLSYGMLFTFIFFFLQLKKKFSQKNQQKILITSLSILFIIAQPILAGPELTGRNIIRLTTLAFILVLTFLTLLFKQKKICNEYKILFILIQIIISFHPTFSILKVLSL